MNKEEKKVMDAMSRALYISFPIITVLATKECTCDEGVEEEFDKCLSCEARFVIPAIKPHLTTAKDSITKVMKKEMKDA